MTDGNIGVIQTMVGELVKKPEHERTFHLHLATTQQMLNLPQHGHMP